MKLFLTSTVFLDKKVTDRVFSYIEKPINECKVLFIPNEKATKERLESDKYLNRVIEWGFSKENIYIFNKYEPSKYKNLDIDIITIGGGNTFGTLDVLRKTSFDKEIINYINNGVVYIGGSAGSHIVTKNVEHVLEFDPNDVGITNFKGLNLFDGIVICHYDDSRKYIYDKLKSNNNIHTLTNDEFIIIEDNKVKKY